MIAGRPVPPLQLPSAEHWEWHAVWMQRLGPRWLEIDWWDYGYTDDGKPAPRVQPKSDIP